MELPPKLGRKADEVLSAYGGLRGLSGQPGWVADAVLNAFFPEDEREKIEKFLKAVRKSSGP